MVAQTELVVNGITIPIGASRNPTIVVTPVENGELIRDWNGTLHDLTLTTHRKRQIVISCEDVRAPELGSTPRGLPATITLPPHTVGASAPAPISCLLLEYEVEREEFQARTAWSMTFLEI